MDTVEGTSHANASLQETLEAEFCPPLDTTLVAAFLADHLTDDGEPTGDALQTLRDHLGLLAASAAADQDDLASDLVDHQRFAQSTTTDDSRDTDSTFDNFGESSSSSSAPSQGLAFSTQLNSALAFLQASFPHISTHVLKGRLNDEELAGELDMERIVEELLTEDYVKELEERGLENDETLGEEIEKWHLVSKKPNISKVGSSAATRGKKKKMKGRTITINDVRQKQHLRPTSKVSSAGDPWNQIVSVSTYLGSLLSRPASFFLSYFHKPDYATPSDALRAALYSIQEQNRGVDGKQDQSEALFTLLEFVCASPEYDFNNIDSEARAQLVVDAELSLAASNNSPDLALDIVILLHEMEVDKVSMQEMGVYHSPASPLSPTIPVAAPTSNSKNSPTVSSPVWSVSPDHPLSHDVASTAASVPPSTVAKRRPPPAPNQNVWQEVKPPRPKAPAVHPLAEFIPSYNPNNVPRRKGQAKKGLGPSAGAEVGTSGRRAAVLGDYKDRIDACRARRNEALRTASRHWAGGSVRSRGGEIALFYALEAQRHQADANRLQLDATRELVERKRFSAINHDTIDLHYCTVAEALTLVREVLDERWVSPARPLHVITGRGSHSTGGVAVLGPALKNALGREGWNVTSREGGLVIRGHSR